MLSKLQFHFINLLQLKESEERYVRLKAELDTKTTSFQTETADLRRVHNEHMSSRADEVLMTHLGIRSWAIE